MQLLADRHIPLYDWPEDGKPAARFAVRSAGKQLQYWDTSIASDGYNSKAVTLAAQMRWPKPLATIDLDTGSAGVGLHLPAHATAVISAAGK